MPVADASSVSYARIFLRVESVLIVCISDESHVSVWRLSDSNLVCGTVRPTILFVMSFEFACFDSFVASQLCGVAQLVLHRGLASALRLKLELV